ncbi:MAG: hypothetical protein FJ276_16870 [Planctomycetes bacterium]|nr:hypothetical protein [Planctomycetota bacterium]
MRIGRRSFLGWATGVLAFGAAARLSLGSNTFSPWINANKAFRDEAMESIPLASLPEPIRSRVHGVITNPTVFRRLPVQVIPCDPDLYLFLIRYPEVVVNMWQLMGVTKVTVKRVGDYLFDAVDGAGTSGRVELVYGTREQHLFLADGCYDGPLVPRRVTGRVVLLLTSGYSLDPEKKPHVSNQLDVFVQLDNVGAEIVAKTLHPLMGKTADSNFVESTRFLSQVSQVVETNGPGIQRLAGRLLNVEPTVRNRFAQIAATINQRAIMHSVIAPENGSAASLTDRQPDASHNGS